MNRRKAAKALALTAPFVMGCRVTKDTPTRAETIGQATIKPKRLRKGDTIGLIAPGSSVSPEMLKKAKNQLLDYGFKLKLGKYLDGEYGYLAATDDQRLEDIHTMYADPLVAGIWCARGGYGCTRLLPQLDYELIRSNPKVLIGYSDITALLNAIYQYTGVIGFHGPVGTSTFNEFTTAGFERCVMKSFEQTTLDNHVSAEVKVLSPGRADGQLVGGNLSLLASMMGTPYQLDMMDKVVFIEDVGEKPYRIDRMLTQLLQAGLDSARAIALGTFEGCEAKEGDKSLTLEQCFVDRLGALDIPILLGLPFGHIEYQYTLPVGIKARLDTDKRTLTLLESAVT